MQSHMNRRAILAGAAVLPAMSIPALAGDAELIALGEQIKVLWPLYDEAGAENHVEHERARELAGFDDVEAHRKMTIEEDKRRWKEAMEKTNYAATSEKWNGLDRQIRPLCEAALALKATTLVGVGVQAAAALYLNNFERGSMPEAEELLVSLANAAGFEVPDED
jgi:hypothetical protein